MEPPDIPPIQRNNLFLAASRIAPLCTSRLSNLNETGVISYRDRPWNRGWTMSENTEKGGVEKTANPNITQHIEQSRNYKVTRGDWLEEAQGVLENAYSSLLSYTELKPPINYKKKKSLLSQPERQLWEWIATDFIFLASAYEGGWPVLSIAFHLPTDIVHTVAELGRRWRWNRNLKPIFLLWQDLNHRPVGCQTSMITTRPSRTLSWLWGYI